MATLGSPNDPNNQERKRSGDELSKDEKKRITELKRNISNHWHVTIADLFRLIRLRPIMSSLLFIEAASYLRRSVKRYFKRYISKNTVLELELDGDYTDEKDNDFIAEILNPRKSLTFWQIIISIYFAAQDERVSAMFLRMDGVFVMGVAQYEELRRALYYFKMYNRQNPKKIVVYADSFGAYGQNAIARYYVASVADKIYMPKVGNFFVGPVNSDYPFLNETLKKLDMSVEVRRRAEFKSALNIFMRDKFDKFHKKQYSDLISVLEYNYVQSIAMARKLRPYKDVTFDVINKATLLADDKDETNSKLTKSDNWSYFANTGFDLKSSVDWCVEKVLEKDKNLSFELPPLSSESKSDADNNDSSDDSNNKDLLRLVRCWSDKVGTYNDPRLYLVLQFWDKINKRAVFYECVIGYPTLCQTQGWLQKTTQESKNESDDNNDDNKVIKGDDMVLISMNLLVNYQNHGNGSSTYDLIKKGDIDIPEADREKDSDFGRSDIVDKIKNAAITINRNVVDMMHHGSYLPYEALELGLIDGIKYYYEMYQHVIPNLLGFGKVDTGNAFEKEGKGEKSKVNYLYLKRYYQRYAQRMEKQSFIGDDWICDAQTQFDGKKKNELGKQRLKTSFFDKFDWRIESDAKIAFIKAHGAIHDGESEGGRLGSKTLVRSLRACRHRSKKISAVILDLDTPGGAATACENMYQEILQCREFGLPVIAVQRNIAASGGYYLSAPCDWVIGSNFTITGSIGIIAGKFETRAFWKNKLGVTYDRVSRFEENSSQFSGLDGIGEYERIRMEKLLTQWYHGFKSIICEPRKIDMNALEHVARGQVWLGSKAHELGLIDQVGGIFEAIRKCKELIYINKWKLKNGNKNEVFGEKERNEMKNKICKQKVKLVDPLRKATLKDVLFGDPVEHENDFSRPRHSIASGIVNLMMKSIEHSCVLKMVGNAMCSLFGINNSLISSIMFINNCAKYQSSMTGMASMAGMAGMNEMNAIGGFTNQLGMIANEISLCCGSMDAIDKYNARRWGGHVSFYQPGLSYFSQQLNMSL